MATSVASPHRPGLEEPPAAGGPSEGLGLGGVVRDGKRMFTVFLFVLYFFSSSVMLIANKVCMTALPAPALVTSIQYIVTAAAVAGAAKCGALDANLSITTALLRKYMPVPMLFSAAIFANGKILEYANIETFLVFRFSTPLIVGIAEFFFLGTSLPSLRSFVCFTSIIVGAVIYVLTDMGFSLRSYAWAFAYTFVITFEMIFVKHVFDTQDMTTWTRVFLNNVLSLVFQPFFILSSSEQEAYPTLSWSVENVLLVVATSFLGLSLAYSGTALRAEVSATSFTLVGVVCKLLTLLLNFSMWDRHANAMGLGALLLCLAGSTFYRPSQRRSPGDFSTQVWHFTDAFCCSLCQKLDLSSGEPIGRPAYQPVATKPEAEGGDDVEENQG